MTNYDLNIWDYSGFPLDADKRAWCINVHECDENWQHDEIPVKIIFLNDLQAEMLTLGVAAKDGGDYDWDDDFWIEPAAFFDVYKNIPRKVTRYLEALV